MMVLWNKCLVKIPLWTPKTLVAAGTCFLLVELVHFVYTHVINSRIISVEAGIITWNSTNNFSSKIQAKGNVTVSVCIPATVSDMKLNLPRLLSSVNIQTYKPMEVVIIMSNTNSMDCNIIKQQLTQFYNASILRLYCVSTLQYQSISRQNASTFAKGEVVSFIDADDVMFPNRIEIIAAIFNKYKTFMVLHSFSNKARQSLNNWKLAKLYDGIKLFDIEKSTRPHHPWLLAEIMHSQVSVLRNVFSQVKFKTGKQFYRTEDSWFVRDVITTFGRKTNTSYYINFPLSWHVPREFQIGKTKKKNA